jgi:hypothetical protein
MSYAKQAILAGCLLFGPALAWAEDPQPPTPIGGDVGYGSAGVVELGGFFGLNAAQNVRDLNFLAAGRLLHGR